MIKQVGTVIFESELTGTKSGLPPLDTTHLTIFGLNSAAHNAANHYIKFGYQLLRLKLQK